VVQRIRWIYVDRSCPLLRDEEGAGIALKVFSDRTRADAHCAALHRRARKKTLPFEHGVPFHHARALPSLAAYTSMPTEDFLRWLSELGLQPPDLPPAGTDQAAQFSYGAWCSWWYENAKVWPPALFHRLWDALDRVALFEVVEVPADL
jgi:hypothetical protein